MTFSRTKRHLSLIAMLGILFQLSLPLPVTAAPSAPVEREPVSAGDVEWVEDVAQRTANRQVFRHEDQVREVRTIQPVRYQTSPGVWVDIDNSLVPDSGEFALRNKGNQFAVRFTNRPAQNRVRLEHNGRAVTFDLPEQALAATPGGAQGPVNARATGNQLTYESVGAPVSFEYQVGATGLREDIWLHRPGAPASFAFPLQVEGVQPELREDGSIWFLRQDSVTERAFYIPAPFAEDANGVQVGARAELQHLGEDRWMVRVSVDRQWLNAVDRAYPVRIDPDVTVERLTDDGGQWLELNSSGYSWSDKRYMTITPSTASPVRTAHMQFDLRDYERKQNLKLESAKLEISIQSGKGCDGNCGATMWLAQEKQEWFSAVAKWSQPAWQGTSWTGGEVCTAEPCASPIQLQFNTNYSESRSNNGPIFYVRNFDVSDMVRRWLDGSVPNNGFLLYNSDRTLQIVSPTYQCCTTVNSRLLINYTAAGAPSVTVDASAPASPMATVTSDSALLKTEIFVDGLLAGTDRTRTAGTFSFTLDPSRFPYGSHQIKARTYTGAGQVAESPPAYATFGDGGVVPPVHLNVSPLTSGMRLTWASASASNPAHTLSYEIVRSSDSLFTSPQNVATGVTGNSYDDTTAAGTPYYKVRAVTSAGVSSEYTEAAQATAPVRPFGLRYQHMPDGAIALMWALSPSAYEDAGITYRLYRDGALIASHIGSAFSSDNGVLAGSSYTYHVTAINEAGQESPASEPITATARGGYGGPAAPALVQALPGRERSVTMTWEPVNDPGVTYEVLRYSGNDPAAYTETAPPYVRGLAGGTWTDDGQALFEGSQYWYRVRAVKDGAAGPWSAPAGVVAVAVPRTGMGQRQGVFAKPWGSHAAVVNLSSGNLAVSVTDAVVPVPNLPLAVQRTYNSQSCSDCTLLGGNWRLSAEWSVEEETEAVFVVEGDGTQHRFARLGGTAFEAEAGYSGKLTRNVDNSWTLAYPDLTAYHFLSDGKLSNVQERNGNELRYTYNAGGRLTGVSAYPVPRSISFAYDDTTGRLRTVTDSAGRQTTYEYGTDGRLARVVNPAGEVIQYRYDEYGRLGLVQDATGRWDYAAYGANGGVSHLVDGLGNATVLQVTPHLAPLLPPTGLVVSNITSTTAQLAWDPVPGAVEYEVRLNGSLVATTTGTTHDLTGLTVGTLYEVRIATRDAYDRLGSEAAASFTPALSAPGTVTVQSVTSTSANVTWTAVSGAAKYRVWYGTTLAGETTGTTLTLYGLSPLTAYTVKVAAVDVTGQEAAPSSAQFTTLLPAPAFMTLTFATDTAATAAWESVTGATKYRVYLDSTFKGETTSTSYSLQFSSRSRYTVSVKPVDQYGREGESNSAGYSSLDRCPPGMICPLETGLLEDPVMVAEGGAGTMPPASETVVTDPLGNRSTYVFDSRGWVTGATDALGHTITTVYALTGNTVTGVTVTNPRGLVAAYELDSVGRVTRVTESAGAGAETQDLVAPGVTSRTRTFAYDSVTGDLLDEAAEVSAGAYHGNTSAYTYTGTGEYPFRLFSQSMTPYNQTPGLLRTPVGGDTIYRFDTASNHPGWVSQIQDPMGYLTDLDYNDDGTVKSITRRNIDGPLVSAGVVTLSRDVVQEFTYYPDGKVKDVVGWHQVGTTGTAVTHYDYDAGGRVVMVTQPDGARTYTMYDPSGLPVLSIDEAGLREVALYDAARRLTGVVRQDGSKIALTYDAAGRNTAVTDPLNQETSVRYDALNRAVRVTDPNGLAKAWTYDSAGNVTAVTTGSGALLDANKGYTVRASYYLAGVLRQTWEPLPTSAILRLPEEVLPPAEPGDPADTTYNITTVQYNLLGQKTEETDGNGYRTGYEYDGLDQLEAVTQFMNSGNMTTRYGYDNNGNRVTVTDPRNRTVRYDYDGLGRLWREYDGRGVVKAQYRYDDAGNKAQKLEPRTIKGKSVTDTTNYAYDPAQRLTRVWYDRPSDTVDAYHPKAPNVEYAYDGAGHRLFMWDGYGSTFYQYDEMGRLQEERGLSLVSYAYDAASRLVAMNTHLGTITYGYDSGNRLTTVRDPLGNQTTYSYDPNYGHRIGITLPLGSPNTLKLQDTYHTLSDGSLTNRLNQRTYNKTVSGVTSQVWQGTYTYDLPGMVRTFSFKDTTTYNHTYTYDQAYRLIQADGASGNTSYPNSYYAYDAAGNRTTWGNWKDSTGQIYNYVGTTRWQYSTTYDDANRITKLDEVASGKSVPKETSYEDNGNPWDEHWDRIGFTPACANFSPNHQIQSHYDDAGRLSVFTQLDWTQLTNFQNNTWYTYDGDGKRLTQEYAQENITSCGSPSVIVKDFTAYEYANGQVLNERTDGSVPVWYIRDPQGNLLYTLHWRSNQLQPDAYIVDRLNSIYKVLDYQGNVANSYQYDAYGTVTSNTTTLRNTFTFTGYGLDTGTGLYHANARYYRPDLGRFTTQDTYKGSPWLPWSQNLYVYVGNNPVNYTDPTGHCPWCAAALIGAVFNTASYFINNAIAGEDSSWQGALVAAGSGALSGALAVSGLGLVSFALASGAINAGETLATDYWEDGDIDSSGGELAWDFAVGAGSGIVGGVANVRVKEGLGHYWKGALHPDPERSARYAKKLKWKELAQKAFDETIEGEIKSGALEAGAEVGENIYEGWQE